LLAARITRFIERVAGGIPEGLWALFFTALFVAIGWAAYRQARSEINVHEEKK